MRFFLKISCFFFSIALLCVSLNTVSKKASFQESFLHHTQTLSNNGYESKFEIFTPSFPALAIQNSKTQLEGFVRHVFQSHFLGKIERSILFFTLLYCCIFQVRCPGNRIFARFLILNCSYKFLRRSVLNSQSHPPTSFFSS